MKFAFAGFAAMACVLGAEAQAPTVDQIMSAYAGAGWFKMQSQGKTAICIEEQGSDFVDRLVLELARRAKGIGI